MTTKFPTDAVAYSYVRFSHPDQRLGDSERRQDDAAAEWCQRNGVRLDTSLSLRDLGVSAYKGRHRDDKHNLGKFLKLIEDGRVPRGAFFIIENLDRLSREDERTALRLWMDILDQGVNIVQLKPETVFRHEKSDMFDIMRAIMELGRGHGESVIKSDRVGAAWKEKKRRARSGEDQEPTKRMGTGVKFVTRRLPAWIREKDGELVLDKAREAVIRKMFGWTIQGMGLHLIVKKLKGVKPWGRGKEWSKAYVYKILAGRVVLGEYQPRTGAKPDGPPVAGYYPKVIDEPTWHRAQASLAARRDRPGRVGKKDFSLFAGLLWDARTESRMLIAWQTRGSGKNRQKFRALVPAGGMEGTTACISFPYQLFEERVLECLREVNPADVLDIQPATESVGLIAELLGVEGRIRQLEESLTGDGEDVPALVRAVKVLEEKRQDLVKRLAVARQQESNPQSVAWAETQSLLDVAKDEPTRLRLRGLLRTIITDVRILVVPRRSQRFALAQINFTEGNRRHYLIWYKAAGNGRKGESSVRSYADVPTAKDIDLRNKTDVRLLEKLLTECEIS